MRVIDGGRFDQPLPVQVNKIFVEGNFDLVITPGQVVPHEVMGLSNYTKNIGVGLGGHDTIHHSHFLVAVCYMETIMSRVETRGLHAMVEACNRFISHRLPVLCILTVMQDTAKRSPLRGLYPGHARSGYEAAGRLSATVTITLVDRPIDRCVLWQDPREFQIN
jgi:hypothetical protein